MCEEKQTTELTRIGGGFWAGGVETVEKGVRKVSVEEAEAEDDEWEKEVAESLDSLKSVAVLEGYVVCFIFVFLDFLRFLIGIC